MEKKKKIIPFTIKMVILFSLVILSTNVFSTLIYSALEYSKYGSYTISEVIIVFFILVILLLSGNKYIFNEPKEKFIKSLKNGNTILFISIFNLILATYVLIFEQKDFNFMNFLCIIAFSISVGLFEEFLCRGWLQNEFIERFGDTKKRVIISIIISSLFFGIMHMSNLAIGQSLSYTLIQVIQTTALGFLLGIIYYKTKNIWTVVFLHGFYDFCILLENINYIKDPELINVSLTSIITTIIISVIWVVSSLKIILKKDNDEENKNIKNICNFIIIILFIVNVLLNFLGNPGEIKEYNYKTLEIKEYITHHPTFTKYEINHINLKNEQIKLSVYQNDLYRIMIKNDNINKDIELNYDIYQYVVISNEKTYGILIYAFDGLYYANLNKEEMNNSLEYLNSIKEKFVKYDVPELYNGGYITIGTSNEKYPYLESMSHEKFIIMNNEIFLMK